MSDTGVESCRPNYLHFNHIPNLLIKTSCNLGKITVEKSNLYKNYQMIKIKLLMDPKKINKSSR